MLLLRRGMRSLGIGLLLAVCLHSSAQAADLTDAQLEALELAGEEVDDPEIGDGFEDDELANAMAPAPCNLPSNPPLFLFYTSIGGAGTFRFLKGCPGEVVIGEKTESGPQSVMRSQAAHRAGGRTAFVLGDHGILIRRMLKNRGVEKTRRYLKKKLDSGYDYIVIDEITAHPDWADGSLVNRRFRELLLRLPKRKVIAYVSIDLTMWDGGGADMRERRLLLRALKRQGRVMALEVYLHTGE